MKKLPAILLYVILATKGFSQNEDVSYKMRADKIRNDIWGANIEAFQVTAVPAEMNNESAVIIANAIEVINSAETKYKLVGPVPKFTYHTTLHHRVKINDKAALEHYSTIEYTKQLNLSFFYGFSRIFNKRDGYIGAKIIKLTGEETIVNTSEEVLTRDEKKYKEGKLAISGLEVGDILDYYIRTETVQEGFSRTQGPYTFLMGNEYPVLYYDIKFQLDNSAGVKYISANGAPFFVESSNENDDIILTLTKTNLPKFQNAFFTSPYRQSPYVTLEYKLVSKTEDRYTDFNRGEVKQGFSLDNIINEYKATVRNFSTEFSLNPLDLTKKYFGDIKKMRDVSEDSIVRVLYDAWRYNSFFFFSTTAIEITHDLNNRNARSIYNAINFSKMLDQLSISNTIYFVSSRYSSSWKNALNLSDFKAVIKVTEGRKYWLAFDDMVTHFGEIPAGLQGEDALLIAADEAGKYYISQDKVPVTTAAQNKISENVSVKFDTAGLQLLLIDRTCQQTGALRHSTQKKLLLLEDLEADLAAKFSQGKWEDRIQNGKTAKKADEFASFFKEERANLKAYFTDEITQHFNAEPKSVNTYKINEDAFFNERKPFEYSSSFSMENLVKKAGDNYILEAGQLIGTVNRIEGKERNRTIDIFRLSPATYSWNVTVSIPSGYHIKGFEEMNKTVSNETGSFSSTATSDGSLINIKAQIVYLHNFEKAESWPKLLEITDALYFFSTQKLLLEKN